VAPHGARLDQFACLSSYNDKKFGILRWSTLVSRFFDLLQRLNQQKGTSPSTSVGVAAQNEEAAAELSQTLSVLLPQCTSYLEHGENSFEPQQILSVLVPEVGVHTDNVGKDSEFSQIPVEEVHIAPTSRIVFHTDPSGQGADRFRFLRMRLRELWNTKKLRTLLITSPLPEDGKSTIALNLATALAEGGKRSVLLIEADFYRSPLTQQLGIRPGPGLAECLEGGLYPLTALRRLEPLGWYLLTAGQPHGSPTELLHGDALSVVMQRLSSHFDWILIDSPPVTPLMDALSLGRHANGTLLVARAGSTPREALEKAITLLGRHQVIGAVLNGVEGLDPLYSGHYGYSGNNNGSISTKPAEKLNARRL
jgi:capsular exopolysaccharide synthesis family protein